jgi:pimeloyl-ACP methyl ester carboxylesterase
MHEAQPIEGVPVTVLTAGNAEPLSCEALRRIGPEAQQVIAQRSGHWIHLDEPELVLEAIRKVVEQVRCGVGEAVAAG